MIPVHHLVLVYGFCHVFFDKYVMPNMCILHLHPDEELLSFFG